MNWTGGTLQRTTAGRHNSVVQRQKEHFAKRRTQLRDGTTPTTPLFRLRFLHQDHLNPGGRLPPFGCQSVRRVRHRRPLQERQCEQSHATSGVQYRQGAKLHHVVKRGLQRESRYESASSASSDHPKRESSAIDDSVGGQLLEAKRRRLLQRRDWVGLAPSRPVNMHFASRRHKARIGKRRKIKGPPAVGPRHSEGLTRHENHYPDTEYPGPYMSRALKRVDEDIEIRIGTDALTTHSSIHQFDHAQPQPTLQSRGHSSDSMLFEHEHLYPALVPMKPACHDIRESSVPVVAFTQGQAASQHPSGSEEPTLGPLDRSLDGTSYAVKQRSSVPFVFDRPSDPVHVGGATNVHDTANAGLSAFGHSMASLSDERGCSNLGAARPPWIVDDGPWRSFLAIPDDGSSCSTTTDASGYGALHLASMHVQRAREPPRGMGSQHATRGDQTCRSSSSIISASLPSASKMPRNQLCRRNFAGQAEELWRSFVLGGGDSIASCTMHAESIVNEKCHSTSASSPYGNFSSTLAIASYASTGTHGEANRKPRSTSSSGRMWISSPVARKARKQNAQEVSGREYAPGGPLSADHSIGDELSVTHASMANNAYHDTDVTLSRSGLSRHSSHFGPALAKGSETERRMHESSVCDIPEIESEEGIDLVDPYRLL